MDETIKNEVLYSIFPGTWDTSVNVAKRIGSPLDVTDEAMEQLLNEGLLQMKVEDGVGLFQMKVEDGVALFGLTRAVSSDDEYLVWIVRRALKKEFGKMPTAESACQFLESRDWKFEDGRTEQHFFKALAAHLKLLTGKEMQIADWSSATLAILEMRLLR